MDIAEQVLGRLSCQSFSLAGLVIVLLSLMNCFLGYRLMRMWTAVLGCVIGMAIGLLAASLFTETGWILLAAALGLGLLLGFLAFRLYLVGVFLYAVITVYGLVAGLIGSRLWWTLALCVILSLVGGILAVNFVRPVIILATAANGGFTAVNAIVGWMSISDARILYGLATVLIALGVAVQLRTTRGL